MERLAREKIATQQHLAELKNELSQWMDVVEIERVLRQTAQPEEDQASTSTASGRATGTGLRPVVSRRKPHTNTDSASAAEGEDMEDDLEGEPSATAQTALPTAPQPMKPELHNAAPAPAPNPPPATATSWVAQHISIPNKAPPKQPHLQPAAPLQPAPKPATPPTLPAATASSPSTPTQPLLPAQTQVVTLPSIHPTVIAHASVSHPSVIQAVNHVLQGGAPKHMAHLAPSTTSTNAVHLPAGHQSISHITVHPLAHLSQHLPALYPQPVAVTQPAVVGHIAHTLNHTRPQMNGATPVQPAAAIMGKQTAMSTQMVAHHPQLMGQTVLNPVTMVTMPSFPISTLKLA